jgi:hypothetical protein
MSNGVFEIRRPPSIEVLTPNGPEVWRIDAGAHRLRFSAAELPSGLYLCRMEFGGKVLLIRMILSR